MVNVYDLNDELNEHEIREHQLLSFLLNNDLTSQRKIAGATGLSLATVNILLKRMVKKGLVKIERINARNVRYILTPKGMQKKGRITYRFIRRSYAYIRSISHFFDDLSQKYREKGLKLEEVYIFGPKDEVHEIISQVLITQGIKGTQVKDADELAGRSGLVVVWKEKHEKLLPDGCTAVNLVESL